MKAIRSVKKLMEWMDEKNCDLFVNHVRRYASLYPNIPSGDGPQAISVYITAARAAIRQGVVREDTDYKQTDFLTRYIPVFGRKK